MVPGSTNPRIVLIRRRLQLLQQIVNTFGIDHVDVSVHGRVISTIVMQVVRRIHRYREDHGAVNGPVVGYPMLVCVFGARRIGGIDVKRVTGHVDGEMVRTASNKVKCGVGLLGWKPVTGKKVLSRSSGHVEGRLHRFDRASARRQIGNTVVQLIDHSGKGGAADSGIEGCRFSAVLKYFIDCLVNVASCGRIQCDSGTTNGRFQFLQRRFDGGIVRDNVSGLRSQVVPRPADPRVVIVRRRFQLLQRHFDSCVVGDGGPAKLGAEIAVAVAQQGTVS